MTQRNENRIRKLERTLRPPRYREVDLNCSEEELIAMRDAGRLALRSSSQHRVAASYSAITATSRASR